MNEYKKGIAILGSTGNIGQQALQVLSEHPSIFHLKILTAGSNADLLIIQAKKYKPEIVFVFQEEKTKKVRIALQGEKIKVLSTQKELFEAFYQEDLHLVLLAMLGFSALSPALAAIEAGKDLALANKESLVVGGELLMQKVKEKSIRLIPIDSEHSAIFQCLIGEEQSSVEKVILTASGGPFYNFTEDEIKKISLKQALQHPTWNMGNKITIDSASMMNKGLEVIEAKWLFHLKSEQIEVVVHPQSAIHSMVQFIDGSIKAQIGTPDMRMPIQYALFYPQRINSPLKRFSFLDYPHLDFRTVDMKKFRNLALAFDAMEKGGNMPAILNAANEAAVDAVLTKKLAFYKISKVVEEMMYSMTFIDHPDLPDLQETHHQTYKKTKETIRKKWKF